MIQNRGDIEMTKKEKIKLDNMRYFGLHREPLYEGEMVNGKLHGHGKLTFEKFDDKYESSFEGYFDDGIPVEGKFNDRFGTIYDGKFEKEDSEISNGRIIYKDGRGNGRIIYKDGSEYVGEWDGLEKWGQGTMVFSNGVEFKGRWHEDCPSDGVMTCPDGTKFKGWFNQLSYEFANGVIHYPDGSKFESEFADVWSANYSEKKDVFEGTFTYPNGKIVEGTLHIALDWDLPISPSKKDRFEPKETI